MGLDVYLYKYENKEESDRKESEYEVVSERNWESIGGYDKASENQKESIRSKNKIFAESIGLDEWGADKTTKQAIEIDSKTDPEHYFKIGYFRSSYNGGGINNILRNLDIPGLYEIFEPNDQYCFQPDWNESLKKCEQSISLLEQKGNYRCFDVSANMFSLPECESEKEALDIFLSEIKSTTGFEQYSNKQGHFYHKDPIKVLALIPGIKNIIKSVPCTYVIIEGDNKYYLDALKIVKETIEYVLAQPDKEKFYLHWSS